MRGWPLKNRRFVVTAAVVLAVLLALPFSPFLAGDSQSAASLRPGQEVFDNSVSVSGRGNFVRIAHSPVLDPSEENDFLLVTWLSLRRVPEEGERYILVSKYDADSSSRQGYSLALDGDKQGVRPSIYWTDSKGRGGWFEFSSLDVQPDQWLMLAVSFRENRYLGLHSVQSMSGSARAGEPFLLGGYDLAGQSLPVNSSDLLYGASRTRLPAELGPIALFAPRDLSSILPKTLRELGARPETLPASLKSENVLWLYDGREDYSRFKHEVEPIRSRRGSN